MINWNRPGSSPGIRGGEFAGTGNAVCLRDQENSQVHLVINQYSMEQELAVSVEGEVYNRGDSSFIGTSIGAGDFSSDQLMQNWKHSIVECEIYEFRMRDWPLKNRLKSTATEVVIFGLTTPLGA